MRINKITVGITGLVLGILANSVDVKTSESFKFNNPVPINASESQVKKIVGAEPAMKDTEYSLDILGLNLPIATYRTVTDSQTGDSYTGRLDANGDIHTFEDVYNLQSAHDSNWYVKN